MRSNLLFWTSTLVVRHCFMMPRLTVSPGRWERGRSVHLDQNQGGNLDQRNGFSKQRDSHIISCRANLMRYFWQIKRQWHLMSIPATLPRSFLFCSCVRNTLWIATPTLSRDRQRSNRSCRAKRDIQSHGHVGWTFPWLQRCRIILSAGLACSSISLP